MLEIEKIYRSPRQRFSEYEEHTLRLAVEAHYSNHEISRIMGRSEDAIRRRRRLIQMAKPSRARAFALIGCLICLGFSAAAHEGPDPLSTWYQSLRDPETGASCCSMSRDCQPVDDYRASATPGGYVVQIEGRSLEVPPSKVLQRTDNPTGHAVVCIGHVNGEPFARCMVRASEG